MKKTPLPKRATGKDSNSKQQNNVGYKKIKLIGRGAFGKVFLLKKLSDGAKCALKEIDISPMENQKEINDLCKEVRILKKVKHPNIIEFYEVFKTDEPRTLYIITEFAEKGDLSNVLKKAKEKKEPIPEPLLIDWFTQMLEALNYLHSNNIIHRDIKPQNIFLTASNRIKLGDFGVSAQLLSTFKYAITSAGTIEYCSPEIVNGELHNFKTDMWSLGVTFYQLLSGRLPFEAMNRYAVIPKIVEGKFEEIKGREGEFVNTIYSLINLNPKERPSAAEILQKNFIKKRAMDYLKENNFNQKLTNDFIGYYNEKKKNDKQKINLQLKLKEFKGKSHDKKDNKKDHFEYKNFNRVVGNNLHRESGQSNSSNQLKKVELMKEDKGKVGKKETDVNLIKNAKENLKKEEISRSSLPHRHNLRLKTEQPKKEPLKDQKKPQKQEEQGEKISVPSSKIQAKNSPFCLSINSHNSEISENLKSTKDTSEKYGLLDTQFFGSGSQFSESGGLIKNEERKYVLKEESILMSERYGEDSKCEGSGKILLDDNAKNDDNNSNNNFNNNNQHNSNNNNSDNDNNMIYNNNNDNNSKNDNNMIDNNNNGNNTININNINKITSTTNTPNTPLTNLITESSPNLNSDVTNCSPTSFQMFKFDPKFLVQNSVFEGQNEKEFDLSKINKENYDQHFYMSLLSCTLSGKMGEAIKEALRVEKEHEEAEDNEGEYGKFIVEE